ncbi:MAG: Mrp/NBP35 family ATP-binding protein [Anaerolineaceae bacterium]|nr:Mrp/NBP35 family ATP-binding protein [Anaerolineaceae bacterium]
MSKKITEEIILKQLHTVMDPELNRDLVSLGMINDIQIEDGNVKFTIELTTPACPLKTRIETDARMAVASLPGVTNVEIKMSARVPQSQQLKEKMELNIKNIIAVSSGKGGVGKTTVAVNLAIALAQSGASVGLMDADIYGPNVPTMMGIKTMPLPRDNKLIPAVAHNVKIISIGFLVKDGQPLIWRGPLLNSTIRQFLTDVDWGDLDYLVVDLPPGTGDVQLSLSQHIPITCGIIVTMPQKVSLEDAIRGVEMFKKLEVPIAGIIENMSAMQMPDGTIINVFGEGGGEAMANAYGLPFLARIPLNADIRLNSDAGTPIVVSQPNSPVAEIFSSIACEVASFISQQNIK